MRHLLLVAPIVLAACSQEAPQAPAGTEIAANGAVSVPTAAPPTLPGATGAGTAFGLTTRQIEDADLVDASGAKLGEVERVVANPSGAITALVVELDDTNPDRFVQLPITGLTAVADGEDWNLRTAASREQLVAMPAVAK
ncbi:PRC-barrel domain-containing protein [Sphingomonas turrisvirgatae]|uniref:PRC-barrel domain-containing protein n=1 Tax=Sphingomonas turrisvirgatae TaxID=1888892 RepID=A0A1E3LVC3_9SPHN|nr:PRC-barrel domain-containing protein [Sphingomonas turrisvirgatae]ODP37721.1 hypothetical protein BFL28_01730 [Sphingomonas turrisvirgatae]